MEKDDNDLVHSTQYPRPLVGVGNLFQLVHSEQILFMEVPFLDALVQVVHSRKGRRRCGARRRYRAPLLDHVPRRSGEA